MVKRLSSGPNSLAHIFKFARVGSLEAEDGLLEIANHEHGPQALLTLARPAKIFFDQFPNDRPLIGVGVLRFIDQYMVGAPVELEPDPVAHPRSLEQTASPGDEVAEIGHPRGLLGARIGRGIGLACAEAGGLDRNQPRRALHRRQPREGGIDVVA